MTDVEQALRDLIGIIDDSPSTFVWSGAEYDCRMGALIASKKLSQTDEGGGWLSDYDLPITTTTQEIDDSGNFVDRFPGYTAETIGAALLQQRVTLGTAVYRVDKVTLDEYGAGLQLGLMTVNK